MKVSSSLLAAALVASGFTSCRQSGTTWNEPSHWDVRSETTVDQTESAPMYELVTDVQAGVPEPVIKLVVIEH